MEDLTRFREYTGLDFDGILGMDYLCRHIVEIDFDAGKLRLLSALPVDPGQKIGIEYLSSGTPLAMFDIGSTQHEWFVLDTGWLVGESAVKQQIYQGLKDQGEIINSQPGWCLNESRTVAAAGNVSRMALGPFRHKSLRIVSANDNQLSLAYLSRFHVTFDFPGRAVYLREGGRYARPDANDASGLLIVKRDGAYVVDGITPGGPGELAGVTFGDAIVRVNGDDAANHSVFELREMFMTDGILKTKGGPVTVSVVRDGKELELTLELRDYKAVRVKSARNAR